MAKKEYFLSQIRYFTEKLAEEDRLALLKLLHEEIERGLYDFTSDEKQALLNIINQKINRNENELTKSKPTPKDDIEKFIPRPNIGTLYVREAAEYLNAHRKYIPEMLNLGLGVWLDKHPQATTFSMTSQSMDNLSKVMSRSMRGVPIHATPIEKAAYMFLEHNAELILRNGFAEALESEALKEYWKEEFKLMHNMYPSTASPMPDAETFKKMVLSEIWRLVPDVYGKFS